MENRTMHSSPQQLRSTNTLVRPSALTLHGGRLCHLGAAFTALVLGACRDDVPVAPGRAPQAQRVSAPSDSIRADTIDLTALPRFTVDLDVKGVLRPGVPVQLTATARANFATQEADVQVVLPEVAALRLKNARRGAPVRLPVGVTLPPVASGREAMSVGQIASRSAAVVFDEPGYYQVWARAIKTSTDRIRPAGPDVADMQTQIVWVLITDTGGRVTPVFDASVFPDGVQPVPGPFRAVGVSTVAARTAVRAMSGVVTVRIVYVNANVPGGAELQPLRQAHIIAGGQNTQTDGDGSLTIACPAGSSRVEVWTENGDIKLRSDYTPQFAVDAWKAVDTYVGADACNQTREILVNDSRPANVWDNAIRTIPASRALLGASRGRIDAYYEAYQPSGQYGAFYSPSYDRIVISPAEYQGYRGVFTIAHEYGHAVHEKALGGNFGGWSCPG